MPLFKIIDATPTRKGTIRASNLDEIINQAKEKLSLLVGENYKIVEEEDGSEIFDAEDLLERAEQCLGKKENLKLMIVPTNADWNQNDIIMDNFVEENISKNVKNNRILCDTSSKGYISSYSIFNSFNAC
ncbi:uncharacterized protein LOC127277007 [Leptopilina boulardi]|uniref:uncharacterized protein LOC127277007 n=1 Tax=Leptopilina boulardi TaxID=63433 RepID=UPI0021F65890|nr:uncharacterized protein LOC127277007 [Leptopilina boulardi]